MKKSFILFISIIIFFSSSISQAETLTIRYPTKKDAFHDAASIILKEAYQAIGIDVVYKPIPSARALLMSNSGKIDGELVRIAKINQTFRNLVRIPVSFISAEQMAWTVKDKNIIINGWNSLRPYRIGFHKGYKAAENGTKWMNVEVVSEAKQAFKMLNLGRIDVAIANKFTGLSIIKTFALDNIKMLDPPVQVEPLYHFLNKKHKALVPKVAMELLKMKINGRVQVIYKEFQLYD
jgi:polar amino acid transport system substrate-binding protein